MLDDLTGDLESATGLDATVWLVIGVVVLLVVLLLIVAALRRSRRTRLYERRFGREYRRTAERVGSTSGAETELDERAARHRRHPLTAISPTRREGLRARWDELQAGFVDAPASTVRNAEVLLDEVARERGYPDADAEQRLRDVALDHSDEVQAYRDASAKRNGSGPDEGDEASLRARMVAGRALLEAILEAGRGGDDAEPARGRASRSARRSRSLVDQTPRTDATVDPPAVPPPSAEQPSRVERPLAEQPPRAEQRPVPPSSERP